MTHTVAWVSNANRLDDVMADIGIFFGILFIVFVLHKYINVF